MAHFETVWTFSTKRFTIALEIEPEDMDPADSFCDQADIDAVRFYARVAVYLDGERIAWDGLGGCAYKSVRDFYTSHLEHKQGDYFTDMIGEACRAARDELRSRKPIYIRADA